MENSDRYDIPGPVDWNNASHWMRYRHDTFEVEVWCKTGPSFQFNLRTRVRPMTETEVILSKLRDHSHESVMRAYGISEDIISPPHPLHPVRQTLIQRMKSWFSK